MLNIDIPINKESQDQSTAFLLKQHVIIISMTKTKLK